MYVLRWKDHETGERKWVIGETEEQLAAYIDNNDINRYEDYPDIGCDSITMERMLLKIEGLEEKIANMKKLAEEIEKL